MHTHPVGIAVNVSEPELSGDTTEQLEDSVRAYAERLVADLDLPILPRVSVSIRPAQDGVPPAAVSIGDHACRMSRDVSRGFPDGLAATISRSLVDNRLLLLTPPVRKALYASGVRSNPALAALSDSIASEVVERLVARCFRVSRCREAPVDAAIMARGGSWIADAVVEDVRCPRVAVRYSPAYRDALAADGSSRLDEMFTLMQEGLFYELGIAFPRIAWETNATLEDRAFQVRINDLEMPPVRGLSLGQSLCNDTAEHLTQRDVEATDIVNPANGNASAVIDDADVAACEARGLTVWDPFGYVILYLSSQLRRFAASYLTVGIVAHDLRQLRSAFPDLVDIVVSRHDAATLTRILGCLLEEELSIRDLPSILDGLLMVNGTIRTDLSDFIVMPAEGSHLVDSGVHKRRADELEPYDYSAFIRSTVFKRYISHEYTRGASALAVYTVDQDIERRLRDVEPEALQAGARRAILDAIVTEVSRLAPTARRPALLTTTTVRRRLRRLVEVELPYLPVLCYQELSPELNIEPIARISI